MKRRRAPASTGAQRTMVVAARIRRVVTRWWRPSSAVGMVPAVSAVVITSGWKRAAWDSTQSNSVVKCSCKCMCACVRERETSQRTYTVTTVDIKMKEMMMMIRRSSSRELRTYCSRIGRHIGLRLDRMVGCDPHSPVEDRDTHHSLRTDTDLWMLDTRIGRCGCWCTAGGEGVRIARTALDKTPLQQCYFSV